MPHMFGGDQINSLNPLEITISGDVIPSTDTAFSGHVVVTTAGTPVQGPNQSSTRGFMITALSTNTGYSWVFPFGSTKALKGYPISVGQNVILEVANLNQVGFDVDTSGDTVCWLKL